MELRHLRYFLAAAQEMSFTKAARTLRISQPPLSRQIKKLEHELGVTLFDRNGRGVMLTAEGRFLRAEASKLLVASERIRRRVKLFAIKTRAG